MSTQEQELFELISLAREVGDESTELQALEKLEALRSSLQDQASQPKSINSDGDLPTIPQAAMQDDLSIASPTSRATAVQRRRESRSTPVQSLKTDIDIGKEISGVIDGLTAIGLGGPLKGFVGAGATIESIGREIVSGDYFSTDPKIKAESTKRIIDSITQRVSGVGESIPILEPQTERGKQMVEFLGQAGEQLAPLGPVTSQLAPIQSAARAARLATPPTVKPSVKNVFSRSRTPNRKQQEILNELRQNPDNPEFAEIIIRDELPVKVPALRESIKQVGDETTAAFKSANPADKKVISQMVDIVEGVKKSPLKRKKGPQMRDLVGDSLAKRIQPVKDILDQEGKVIQDYVENRLSGNQVNITEIKSTLDDSLRRLRVNVNDDGTLGFDKSAIRGKGFSNEREVLNDLFTELQSDSIDAGDLHFIKQLIDERTTFGDEKRGISGKTDRFVKNIRFDIKETLNENFPEYGKANLKYSEMIRALDDLHSAFGKKVDITNPRALGTASRKLFTNYRSSDDMYKALDQLEETLGKYNINFDDDIIVQADALDRLEARFPFVVRPGTIRSQIKQAGVESLTEIATTDPKFFALKKAFEKLSKSKGVDDTKALNSIRQVLMETE